MIDVHFRVLVIRSTIIFLLRLVLSACDKVINKNVSKVEFVLAEELDASDL